MYKKIPYIIEVIHLSDNLTQEQRSKTMRAIKSRSQLENRVSKALWRDGYRFRKNDKSLIGKPDISIKKYKIVIFIDSCFWHGCPLHGNMPKSNREYWEKKLSRNKERDQQVNEYYKEIGWSCMRVWEHELKQNFDQTVEKIKHFIDQAKRKQNA
jgi:DNA mismatch endonuclease, patch repair protein